MEKLFNTSRQSTLEQLRKDILAVQGFRKAGDKDTIDTGLGPIEQAFPGNTFPVGAIHEFTSHAFSHVASTNGFIAGIASKLLQKSGTCIWVSNRRTLYPAALKLFGIDADRIIFVDSKQTKQGLWAIEEALKCSTIAAVVGELSDLTFTQSRRLQLAVEQSHVTGFIHRIGSRTNNNLACVSRWKISPIASISNGLPGLGYPRWQVQLDKVRNGMPGNWQVEWTGNSFSPCMPATVEKQTTSHRKAG